MRRFTYMRDPLFLLGSVAYAFNRWLIKPHFHSGFIHSQFNDLWLIPCALPPVLWLHRKLGLRSHDDAPRFTEIFCHLVFWSVLFEWIGPRIVSHAVGDFTDVIAYTVGAIFSAFWWQRERCASVLKST